MNRQEFLEVLNMQLEGEIPSNEISQHLTYYNNFINQKMQQGKSEDDVINELGDPRLIAKTLIDTEDVPNIPGYQQSYAYAAEEAGQEHSGQYDSQQEDSRQESSESIHIHRLDLSTWRGKLTLAAAALILAAVLLLILGALLPIAAIAAVIAVICAILRNRR